MSRIAQPSEKVLAVAKTFLALKQELHNQIALGDPGVQATLLDVAARIAMGTDTRDLGVLGIGDVPCTYRFPLGTPDEPIMCDLPLGHPGGHVTPEY